MAKTYSIRLEW